MTGLLDRLVGLVREGGNRRLSGAPTSRVSFAAQPEAIYAIGDVHGCLDLLRALEAKIFEDAAEFTGERWIIVLGDFVDRGPTSAAVIDHLMKPLANGLRRLVLMGNHEAMMQAFLATPQPRSGWLETGGRETLLSYGVPFAALGAATNGRSLARLVHSYVPGEHIEYLQSLPTLIETPRQIFVHAGLRPKVPVAEQAEPDLLWYRDDFTHTFEGFGKTVVHGHQMRETPLVTDARVALDTGAYHSGRLSAARFTADGTTLLSVERSRPGTGS